MSRVRSSGKLSGNSIAASFQRSPIGGNPIRDDKRGIVDDGVQPLQHVLDTGGANSVAITLEENAAGEIYPVLYTCRDGATSEHPLPTNALHDFRTSEHEKAVIAAVEGVLL